MMMCSLFISVMLFFFKNMNAFLSNLLKILKIICVYVCTCIVHMLGNACLIIMVEVRGLICELGYHFPTLCGFHMVSS